jgi:hypothetical protein
MEQIKKLLGQGNKFVEAFYSTISFPGYSCTFTIFIGDAIS